MRSQYKFKLHQRVRVLPGCIVGHDNEVRDITYRENYGRGAYGLRGIHTCLFFEDELEAVIETPEQTRQEMKDGRE